MNQSLNEKSLIVSLNVSQWSARKHDKSITSEVEQTHNAKDAGRFNKLLIAKEKIEPVQQIVSKARKFHAKNTLAWNDSGERLLPSDNYFTYMEQANQIKKEFEGAVQHFISGYEQYIQEAEGRLGTMFRSSDYPSRTEIEQKFAFKVTALPVPTTDFRVTNLGSEELEQLKSAATTELSERLNGAVKDIWNRIKEQLVRMRDILSKESKETRITESLFGNLKELVDILPRLNVTEDENITAICEEMKSLITDTEAVRNNPELRTSKAQEVEAVMDRFKSFF